MYFKKTGVEKIEDMMDGMADLMDQKVEKISLGRENQSCSTSQIRHFALVFVRRTSLEVYPEF